MQILDLMTAYFPLWVLVASIVSFFYPGVFTWFTGPLIPIGLGIIMLGMGLTLRMEDFSQILLMPRRVLLGVFLQYLVMPFLGYGVAILFRLSPPLAAGLILVASCPGGTASNVISYLARANVALSVTMTSISTLAAVFLTPALTTYLVGNRVAVDSMGLFLSTLEVVIIPIAAGVVLNRFLPRLTKRILPAAPVMAVVMIVLIVASIIGQGRDNILQAGGILLLAVFTLHAGGFLLGYLLSRLLVDENSARTISIEVGMQNSGLGVVLARANFANPMVAIPSAISSLTHSLIGSILAAIFRTFPPSPDPSGQDRDV